MAVIEKKSDSADPDATADHAENLQSDVENNPVDQGHGDRRTTDDERREIAVDMSLGDRHQHVAAYEQAQSHEAGGKPFSYARHTDPSFCK